MTADKTIRGSRKPTGTGRSVMAPIMVSLREIVASLMCSRFYFELSPPERLALVKHLARDRSPEVSFPAVYTA